MEEYAVSKGGAAPDGAGRRGCVEEHKRYTPSPWSVESVEGEGNDHA